MAPRGTLPFTVRWTGAQRVLLWIATLIFATLAIGLSYLFWATDEVTGPKSEPDERWWARGIALFFVWGAVVVLAATRFDVWLAGGRLVRQGAFWRRSLDLRRARFSMKRTTWHYTRRLGPMRMRRITITAPTLVTRTSLLRSIKLPLAQRTGHDIVGNRVIVAWLPQAQLDALADAIDQHGTAPNKAKVAYFLRNLAGSRVQPGASVDSPFL